MTDVVADAYATMAAFRTYLRVTATTDATDPDTTIELLALEAAARAIDRECGRTFRVASTTVARRFNIGTANVGRYSWFPRYGVEIDDVMDTTGLTASFDTSGNGTFTSTTTSFRVMPYNAPTIDMPYRSLLFDIGVIPPPFAFHAEGVQVVAKWGWTAIPSAVVTANLIQAERFVKRRGSPFGIAGSPEMGNEMRLLSKLDPDVAVTLAKYKLDWGNQ